MYLDNMAVGDEVLIPICDDGLPLWDHETKRREKFSGWLEGTVGSIDRHHNTFRVVFPNSSFMGWNCNFTSAKFSPDPEEYFKLKKNLKTAAAPPVSELKPIWTEKFKFNTSRKVVSEKALAEAIDRGERGVRRVTRYWPDNSSLEHKLIEDDNPRLVFYWKELEGAR